MLDARDYGVVADGSTDDTTAFRAFVTAAQNTVAVGVHGRVMELPPGEIVLSGTIDFDRFAGVILGYGRGISPAYTADPGKATVFRWNGVTDIPMFQFNNSGPLELGNFRMEGKDAAPPSYAICFNSQDTGQGNNSVCYLHDLYLGRYTWSSQGTNKGIVKTGIGWIGDNANNDQFWVHRVWVNYPSRYGVEFLNSQSVAGMFNCLTVVNPTLAGAKIGAASQFYLSNFEGCPIDFDISEAAQTGTPSVNVYGHYSENTGCLARIDPSGILNMYGGQIGLSAVITGGDVMVQMYPTHSQRLSLHDVVFTGMSDATQCKINLGPASPYVGNFLINVDNCMGITPAQLTLDASASFWATVPVSQGTIEWHSVGADAGVNTRYKFRNELRRGERVTINTNAWDYPRSSASTSADTVPSFHTGPTGSATKDWADLASGAEQTQTVTCTGAALGDLAEASMSVDLAGTKLTAYVSAADTVTVIHRNDTGGNVNLASGTLRVATRRIS
jgi:hypothetical protein